MFDEFRRFGQLAIRASVRLLSAAAISAERRPAQSEIAPDSACTLSLAANQRQYRPADRFGERRPCQDNLG